MTLYFRGCRKEGANGYSGVRRRAPTPLGSPHGLRKRSAGPPSCRLQETRRPDRRNRVVQSTHRGPSGAGTGRRSSTGFPSCLKNECQLTDNRNPTHLHKLLYPVAFCSRLLPLSSSPSLSRPMMIRVQK